MKTFIVTYTVGSQEKTITGFEYNYLEDFVNDIGAAARTHGFIISADRSMAVAAASIVEIREVA